MFETLRRCFIVWCAKRRLRQRAKLIKHTPITRVHKPLSEDERERLRRYFTRSS
jgi:hypothetical protein